jgi:hypothetical protein
MWMAAVAVFACTGPRQAYLGPERPRSEIALLRAGTDAGIHAINGTRSLGSFWALLPGEHEVWLRVRMLMHAPNVRWTVWSYCRVIVQLAAGEEYASRVRVQRELAPGLREEVNVEIGIVDSDGDLQAQPVGCSPNRPDLEG